MKPEDNQIDKLLLLAYPVETRVVNTPTGEVVEKDINFYKRKAFKAALATAIREAMPPRIEHQLEARMDTDLEHGEHIGNIDGWNACRDLFTANLKGRGLEI